MLGANSGPELSSRGSSPHFACIDSSCQYEFAFFHPRLLFCYRTKPAECEGVPCSQEAEVSVPGGARGRPRKGGACSAKGARDGKSYS